MYSTEHQYLPLCLQLKDEYLACLKANGGKAEACTAASKRYLECRMERCGLPMARHGWSSDFSVLPRELNKTTSAYRNLMAPQDLKDLGYKDEAGSSGRPRSKEAGRFVI